MSFINKFPRFASASRAAVCALLLLMAGAVSAEPGSVSELLLQAKAMTNQGSPAKAYALLLPYEDSLAGLPEYDYLLGVAALDSGEANYSVIALQRAIATKPEFAGAHLDIARAYYQLGELNDAEASFHKVLDFKPAPAVKNVVNQYLAAINAKRTSGRTVFSSFLLRSSIGSDSNANNATSDKQFLGYNLTDISRATPTSYYTADAGFGLNIIPNPVIALNGGVNVRRRNNLNATFVNSSVLEANGGFRLSGQYDQLTVGGNAARVDVGLPLNSKGGFGALSNYNGFVTAQWRHNIDVNDFFNVVVRGGLVRYPAKYQENDINQFALGAGFTTRREKYFFSEINANSIYGRSQGTQTGSTATANFGGLRVQANRRMSQLLNIGVGASLIRTDYDALFFGTLTRSDTRADMNGSLDWYFTKWLSLQTRASYVYSNSSISLYKHQRFEYSAGLEAIF